MSLDELATRFGLAALSRAEWTHVAHLSVGAWHVHRFGPDEALARLRVGIRALNERNGVANTESGGYHETITVAYVRLIEQFLARFEAASSLDLRLEALLKSRLADRAFLFRFWSREQLMSPTARARWMPPDLMPLALSDGDAGLLRGGTAAPR